MDELTRTLEGSPRKMIKQFDESPRKPRVARRQSTAVLGTSNRSSYQHLLPRSSIDTTIHAKYSIPRASFETVKPLEQRSSFERKPPREPRSSLETKVLRGLRGSFETTGPRLQRSTSGLAFDDSDMEKYLQPKR